MADSRDTSAARRSFLTDPRKNAFSKEQFKNSHSSSRKVCFEKAAGKCDRGGAAACAGVKPQVAPLLLVGGKWPSLLLLFHATRTASPSRPVLFHVEPSSFVLASKPPVLHKSRCSRTERCRPRRSFLCFRRAPESSEGNQTPRILQFLLKV